MGSWQRKKLPAVVCFDSSNMDLGTKEAKARTDRFYKKWLTPDLYIKLKTKPNFSAISDLKCFRYEPMNCREKKFLLVPLITNHQESDHTKIFDVEVPSLHAKKIDFRLSVESNIFWSIGKLLKWIENIVFFRLMPLFRRGWFSNHLSKSILPVIAKEGDTSNLPFLKANAVPIYSQPLESEPHKKISLDSLQVLVMNMYQRDFSTSGNVSPQTNYTRIIYLFQLKIYFSVFTSTYFNGLTQFLSMDLKWLLTCYLQFGKLVRTSWPTYLPTTYFKV